MKTLFILRHAKASKHAPVADHDRPLNRRGLDDAYQAGLILREWNALPDMILCSTARRTRETATHVSAACGYTGACAFHSHLYGADAGTWLAELRHLEATVTRVLIVGHNPGLEDLLSALVGAAHPLPTAALAHVELAIPQWRALSATTIGTLLRLWTPRQPDALCKTDFDYQTND